jgi:anthranilate synthase/aminodeoxychorismate synthase-like glutamine amidotransferase
MLLIIDNYDSFTYNLFQYVSELSQEEILVLRNDQFEIPELSNISKIILSPGPKTPKEAGKSLELIQYFKEKTPIFGICLGFQSIIDAFGGKIIQTSDVMHGKTSHIYRVENSRLFKNFPEKFRATRYHSLIADRQSFPEEFKITAETQDKKIMAFEHRSKAIFGTQYHPESILTEFGKEHFKNFLSI